MKVNARRGHGAPPTWCCSQRTKAFSSRSVVGRATARIMLMVFPEQSIPTRSSLPPFPAFAGNPSDAAVNLVRTGGRVRCLVQSSETVPPIIGEETAAHWERTCKKGFFEHTLPRFGFTQKRQVRPSSDRSLLDRGPIRASLRRTFSSTSSANVCWCGGAPGAPGAKTVL